MGFARRVVTPMPSESSNRKLMPKPVRHNFSGDMQKLIKSFEKQTASVQFRHELRTKQNATNIQSEFDRLRGIADQSRVHHAGGALLSRITALSALGAKV